MQLTWIERAASTQDLLAQAARQGADPHAVATLAQSGGRGRRGRPWVTPPGAGLALSVLLRPRRSDGWTLLPLVAGGAVADALRQAGADDVVLKWPNDVLAHGGKVAGLLAERVEGLPAGPGPALVLGIGLNLHSQGMPDGAVALDRLVPGVRPDAHLAATMLLDALAHHVELWEQHEDMAAAYRERCSTLGQQVRVMVPGGETVQGRAVGIDADGQLVLAVAGRARRLSAGDVVHLRWAGRRGSRPRGS
jgi:BirA family transcriptional regulator, biotin operon repressor / biotin---[acetyl-CoA-carboxylase] ligase